MLKRSIAATAAAFLALAVVASPAFADTDYAGTQASIDWRLVVILTVVSLVVFYAVNERANRGR